MLLRVYDKYVFKSQRLDSSRAKIILQFLFKLMIDSHAILYHQRKRRHTKGHSSDQTDFASNI